MPDKLPVIAREAQKPTQGFRRLRLGPIGHCLQLRWINLDYMG